MDALTGAVDALRKKGNKELPRDPRDAARLTPKSSPHGPGDFSRHGPHDFGIADYIQM